MKKYTILLTTLFLTSFAAFSQGGLQNILFTAKANPINGLDIYAKNISGSTITGAVGASLMSVSVLLPSSINPQPTVTATSSAFFTGTTWVANSTVDLDTINGTAYSVYTFVGNGSSTVSFPSNTEEQLVTVGFSGSPVATSDLVLAMLPLGGSSGFDYAYIAPGGTDQTDYSNPFYSDIPSDPGLHNANGVNDPSANGLSYLIITNVPVPVQFTGFSAVKKDDNAIVNWAVANEDVNTDHYTVQRSLDGTKFTDIATVAVKGNSSTNSYAYTDNNISALNTSVIYYRVAEIDKNGKTTTTSIKAVSIASGAEIKAYPNPTKGNVTVTINLQAAADLAVSLIDPSGKTVQQLQIAGAKGTNTQPLNLSGYAAGSYLLKVTNGTEITTLPIVKQ